MFFANTHHLDHAAVIDYLFVGPGVQVESHGYQRVIEDGVFVSDHWPLVSLVVLPA